MRHRFIALWRGFGAKKVVEGLCAAKHELQDTDGLTTLAIVFDAPPEQAEKFKASHPKALEQVKVLAESKE